MRPNRSPGIGREFLRLTRYRYLEMPDQLRGEPEPPPVWIHPGATRRAPLPAPDATPLRVPETIPLPAPDVIGIAAGTDLRTLLRRRASTRQYADQALSFGELGFLLWATQGVRSEQSRMAALRTAPSAGARHACETLLLVHRVDELAAGLYQYHPLEHALIPIPAGEDLDAGVVAACHGQSFVGSSAVTFFWVAVPYRMTWRYGERGYRYLYLDAGHIAENLYLAAEAIGAGACAVAAFDDEALDAQLGLSGDEAFALYLAAVGKRPER